MDRTTILHKLESYEQRRLAVSRIRSRDFRYMLPIPVFEFVILGGVIAHEIRSLGNR